MFPFTASSSSLVSSAPCSSPVVPPSATYSSLCFATDRFARCENLERDKDSFVNVYNNEIHPEGSSAREKRCAYRSSSFDKSY